MDLLPRPRLFRRLDTLRRSHPVSWIAAPAGFGKTSLLVSYIETRKIQSLWYRVDEGDSHAADLFFYLRSALEVFERSRRAGAELPSFSAKADVGTFSRRFFEAYFARLPAGAMLVLDDYHLAPDSSSWQGAFEKIVANVPPRMNVVVLSRLSPPALAGAAPHPWRHRALGARGASTHRRRGRRLGATAADGCEEERRPHRSQGGLRRDGGVGSRRVVTPAPEPGPRRCPIVSRVLRCSRFSTISRAPYSRSSESMPNGSCCRRWLFPASPRRKPRCSRGSRGPTRSCVTSTAPVFSSSATTQDSGVYHFHSLFRTFLAYRSAQALGPEESRAVRTRAAHLLRADGRDEEAFELFLDIGEVQAATELVLATAATLFSEGRGTLLDSTDCRAPPGGHRGQRVVDLLAGHVRAHGHAGEEPRCIRARAGGVHREARRGGCVPGLGRGRPCPHLRGTHLARYRTLARPPDGDSSSSVPRSPRPTSAVRF